MGALSIKLRGVEQAVKGLERYARTKNDRIREATKIAAVNVDLMAKQNAPVDTGRLRSSLTFELEGLTGVVFTVVDYAPHVEYGTVRARAQPFLFPAWESERPKYEQRIKEILRQLS